MSTKNSVAWGRPVRDRYNDLSYASKCGRFIIERREYVLPYAAVGYKLRDKTDGTVSEHDSLAEAKETAAEIVAEETSACAST